MKRLLALALVAASGCVGLALKRPPAKRLPEHIAVFAPVPKDGCPEGYYAVGHTFWSGLDWQPACWWRGLNRIENDHKILKERKYENDKKHNETPDYQASR